MTDPGIKTSTGLSDDQILAGAKFYARASAHRAVHGVAPNWDGDADDANWERTPKRIRDECLDMVRGIEIAACFERRRAAAAVRAQAIVRRMKRAKS
jgi:hypothetical protein